MQNDFCFFGGFALFVTAFLFYGQVVRGTLWALPVLVVGVCAVVLMTVAFTKERYGQVSSDRVIKVVLYTICFNIAGGLLLALGSLIWR